MSERLHLVADGPPRARDNTVVAGQYLPLNSASAIKVLAGRIEIYALCGGRRHFLAEFGAGAILFGGESLIALVQESAKVAALSIGALDPVEAVGAIDRWVAVLSAGLAAKAGERPPLRAIAEGERLSAAPSAPAVISALRGVLWVCDDADTARRFMGAGPHLPEGPQPITPATWIVIEAGTIQAVPTAALLDASGKGPDATVALAAFHAAVAAVLLDWDARARADEGNRIAGREAHTETRLVEAEARLRAVLASSASHALAAPGVAPGAGHEAVRPEAHTHAILEALIGEPLGPAPPVSADAAGDFVAYATASGFHTRTVRLIGPWWRSDRGRLAARRRRDGRLVALLPDWLGRYRLIVLGEPARLLTDVLAAELEPTAVQVLKPLPNSPLTVRDVVVIGLRLCRHDVATVVVASFIASLLGLAMPIAIGKIVDVFIPNQLRNEIVLVGLGLGVLALATTLLRAASDVARLRIDGQLSAAIQTGVIDRALRMPSSLLRKQSSADLAMRVMSVEQMRRVVTDTVLDTLLSGLFGLSGLALLFFYSPPSAFAALALFVLLALISFLAARAQLRQLTVGETMSALVSTLTLQLIQNVSTLRAFGAERRAFAVWARNLASMRSRMFRSRLVFVRFEAFVASYDLLALATVFAVLGYADGGLPTGGYLAFIVTYRGFLSASEALGRAVVRVTALKPLVARAALVLETVPETSPQAKHPGILTGLVEASSLSFAYGPGLPPVLQDVSIRVLPGQCVALVGPSGSGKSTLVNVILGFDEPSAGVVLFDGHDLTHLDKSAVRRQIGIVRQGGRLFAGSLFDNIRGMHDGSLQDAWAAAEAAGIAADIRAMPMDMHTMLNEGMSTLSGGQVQRLLLARALMGSPRLLILDEATSALDNITQSIVTDNIERLGLTRIIVAHRLSTIRKADVIHFLLDGRIAESGSYDELMRRGGRFAAFVRRQAL